MASASVQVAEAVKKTLNAAQLTPAFEAKRNYADWDEKLEDLDTIHVDVMPAGFYKAELETRATTVFGCLIWIVVRKRFTDQEQLDDNTIDPDKIDEMVALCEAIHLLLAAERLATFDDAAWDETMVKTEFDRKHLREHGQFTGVLRVGYYVPVANT